jgi:hypothetical protein
MSLKPIISGTPPLATDVDQYRLALTGLADIGALILCQPQSTPIAPTITAGTIGNPNGTYRYKTVLITGFKQSDGSFWVSSFAPSADSLQITLTNQRGNLTGVTVGTAVVIGRAIYRTAAGGAVGTEQYCGIIWDNVTNTYVDNLADASLGTGMPNSISSPAAYGTAIPANVPVANTTGTTLQGAVNPLTNPLNYAL